MHADWSVACGADDPAIVIPWTDKIDGPLRYVDLRNHPSAIEEIPEAVQYPCLAAALLQWNAPLAPLFTAKCDVWSFDADEFDAEDLPGHACAHASYIDLVPKRPEAFSSFAASERQLRSWTAFADSIDMPAARCEWTLRPAMLLAGVGAEEVLSAQSGFAATLYVWGYGASQKEAAAAWCAALEAWIGPVMRACAL
ncbi:MAG: hypothetical protein ACYDC6_09770 [Acidobacteriaceae bacterium]